MALQGRKNEMEEELKHIQNIKRESESIASGAPAFNIGAEAQAKTDRATDTFERAKGYSTGLLASSQPSAVEKKKLDELDRLSRDNRIKERMAILKSQR